MPEPASFDALSCPVPIAPSEQILLGHGSGGKLTNDLIRRVFVPAFRNDSLESKILDGLNESRNVGIQFRRVFDGLLERRHDFV